MKFINNGYRWAACSRLAIATVAVFFASSLQAQLQEPEHWQSELFQDHELVGKIWSNASQEFVSVDELAEQLKSAKYLLLGEKHDNPDHHAIQLSIVEFLLREQRVGSLTLEMMDESVGEALDQLYEQATLDENALKSYLSWDDEGWDWDFYGPIIASAYSARVNIVAGNISRATVGAVYGDENAVAVNGILSSSAEEQLLLDIDESHCGQLPASQFPAMMRVQQARDLTMADSMARPESGEVAVLIAGNYHIRQDLGVPNYLRKRDGELPDSTILSVAAMEVSEGETDPRSYQESLESQAAYDYLWFTPALTSEDYCASLR